MAKRSQVKVSSEEIKDDGKVGTNGEQHFDGGMTERDNGRRLEAQTDDRINIPDSEYQLLDHIQECIQYTRSCLSQNPPQTPHIVTNIPASITNPPSLACKTLRKAAQSGIAQLAWSSEQEEVYTIGVPPPVKPVGWGEHWWLGLSPAQVRAGPGADEHHIRRTEGHLRQKAKRGVKAEKNRNGRLNVALRKAEEGVRRQEQGLRMYGSEDEAEEDVERGGSETS